mgnify:CR=1 FL=1
MPISTLLATAVVSSQSAQRAGTQAPPPSRPHSVRAETATPRRRGTGPDQLHRNILTIG